MYNDKLAYKVVIWVFFVVVIMKKEGSFNARNRPVFQHVNLLILCFLRFCSTCFLLFVSILEYMAFTHIILQLLKHFKSCIIIFVCVFSGLVPAETTLDAGDCCQCQPSNYVLQPLVAVMVVLCRWLDSNLSGHWFAWPKEGGHPAAVIPRHHPAMRSPRQVDSATASCHQFARWCMGNELAHTLLEWKNKWRRKTM